MRFLLILLMALPLYAQDNGPARADWLHYGGTQLSWRYSALDQINTTNVRNLLPAWNLSNRRLRGDLHSTPIVVDGVMYLISARAQVNALDAATGRVIWQTGTPHPGPAFPAVIPISSRIAASPSAMARSSLARRTTSWSRSIRRAAARSGKSASIDPKQCGCNITAAPLVVKDKVIIGGNGGDQAHRGYLTAFYAKTGRLAWRW